MKLNLHAANSDKKIGVDATKSSGVLFVVDGDAFRNAAREVEKIDRVTADGATLKLLSYGWGELMFMKLVKKATLPEYMTA